MAKRIVSDKKASAAYLSLFLIGIGILIWSSYWWPGVAIVLSVSLALRQFLVGRRSDMWTSLMLGSVITLLSIFSLDWAIVLPVLFIFSGLYIFFRDFLGDNSDPEITLSTDNIDDEE